MFQERTTSMSWRWEKTWYQYKKQFGKSRVEDQESNRCEMFIKANKWILEELVSNVIELRCKLYRAGMITVEAVWRLN